MYIYILMYIKSSFSRQRGTFQFLAKLSYWCPGNSCCHITDVSKGPFTLGETTWCAPHRPQFRFIFTFFACKRLPHGHRWGGMLVSWYSSINLSTIKLDHTVVVDFVCIQQHSSTDITFELFIVYKRIIWIFYVYS